MNRGLLVAGVALAAASIAAGCGGGSDSTSSSGASGATGAQGTALTKDQFVQQADAICKQTSEEINQKAKAAFGNGQPSASDVTKFAQDDALPATQAELDKIRALSPPSADQDQVSAIVDAAQQGVDQLKQDPSQFAQSGGTTAFKNANQLAQQYGLKVCGKG